MAKDILQSISAKRKKPEAELDFEQIFKPLADALSEIKALSKKTDSIPQLQVAVNKLSQQVKDFTERLNAVSRKADTSNKGIQEDFKSRLADFAQEIQTLRDDIANRPEHDHNDITSVINSLKSKLDTLKLSLTPLSHHQNTDTALGQQTQDIDMGGNRVINLAEPRRPSDAATKGYTDKQRRGSVVISGGGAGAFIGMSDTPDSYAGESGKVVSVKSTEDGLEFTTPSVGTGDMEKAIYDPNDDGVIDAAQLDPSVLTADANLTDDYILRGKGGAKGVQTSGVTIDDNNVVGIPGRIYIGSDAGTAYGFGLKSATAGYILYRIAGNNYGPDIYIAKARGSIGAETTVVNGDAIGNLSFQAYEGNELIHVASINVIMDGVVANDDTPARIDFYTCPDGTKVKRLVASLRQTGILELLYGLDVTGDIVVSGTVDGVDVAAHTSRHTVGGADTVFPADPGADRYLMWDDDPGALVWAAIAGGGDMLAATYDPAAKAEQVLTIGDLENPPTEDLATKAPTSEWAFDHNADVSAHHVKYTDAEAKAAAVQSGAITDGVTLAPTHDAVYDVKVTADAAQPAATDDADAVAAVAAAGLVLAAGKAIEYTTPTGSRTASGIIKTKTAGAALVFGNACYMGTDGKMEKALADDAAITIPATHLCLATIAENDAGLFLEQGEVYSTEDSWAWDIGKSVYLSAATAGLITKTMPVKVTGNQVQVLGMATAADTIYWSPSLIVMEYA